MSKLRNLIFLGPPGAGKGTQARKVSEKYGIPQISTGDLMRAVVNSDTPRAQKIKSFMASGALVPDEMVVEILLERIQKPDSQDGFILDGFPRTVPQAQSLETALDQKKNEISAVISIAVPDEPLVDRLTKRRNCACGASYHLLYLKPKRDGICDHCNGELFQRKDDTEDVILNRLRVYHAQTAPLIDFYTKKNLLYTVDGQIKIEMIFSKICDIIDGQV